jgi:lipid II:glycine glycyltransferase (peptidoglycan interpeptide bridge formation enzyme)
MEIREINDKKLLDAFVGSQKMSQFLQSWAWGQFQQGLGRKNWRFGVLDGQSLVASALAIKHNMPLGKNYLYLPRGPIVNNKIPVANFQNAFRQIINKIMEVAKQEGSIFMRFEPPLEKTSQPVLKSLVGNDYKLVTSQFVQPKDTLILNLSKTEEQLLSEMHPKTRYNIRLAEKKGIKVRMGVKEDFEKFWQLNLETASRDSFKKHPKNYYQKMLEVLSPDFLKLFLAEYESKVLVANLVVFFGDTVTYLHGASSNEYRNLMAPHLVQWKQIQEARNLGFKNYDFWGVIPGLQTTDYRLQSWSGLTRFKKGFGGFEVNYVGTDDLILDGFWYNIYRLGRRFLRR